MLGPMPSRKHDLLVAFLRANAEGLAGETIESSRARLDELGGSVRVPDGTTTELVTLSGVPCARVRPSTLPDGATRRILYLHGGSYTAGSLTSHGGTMARLAVAAGAEVVGADYRLAPEHPFPAGLDDAGAVYHALLGDGTSPDSVVVAGDSAGGGLAAALLLRLRDAGDPLPAGGVLLSPWLDLTLTSEAVTAVAAEDPVLRADALARSARAYAGDDLVHPLVSPAFADPAGLPPLLILVGTAEILLDDSVTFATRARDAGVVVDLDVGPDLIHVWPAMAGIPEAEQSLERIGHWIRARAPGPAPDRSSDPAYPAGHVP